MSNSVALNAASTFIHFLKNYFASERREAWRAEFFSHANSDTMKTFSPFSWNESLKQGNRDDWWTRRCIRMFFLTLLSRFFLLYSILMLLRKKFRLSAIYHHRMIFEAEDDIMEFRLIAIRFTASHCNWFDDLPAWFLDCAACGRKNVFVSSHKNTDWVREWHEMCIMWCSK